MMLSRLHYPVHNLGYGVRAGIWFQGCTVHCHGCVSRDTWPFDESRRIDLSTVMSWLEGLDGPLDGITISGGEPTDQPEALLALVECLAPIRRDSDILLYSGKPVAALQHEVPWLWQHVDLLISDPFDANLAGSCALRGSSNQRVHRLSSLAWQRYPDETFEHTFGPQRQQVSVHVDDHAVWMVGIPKPGDLRRLEGALTERGISVRRTSWLT